MKITSDQLAIERQLNPRLKIMGLLLFFCALCAIAWDFLPAAEDEIDALLLEIEEAPPPIDSTLAASSFALVGTCCLFIYWRKKKILS